MESGLATTRATGFTLVELAVVVAIVALLLGSLMYTLAARTEQRSHDDTRDRLNQARELVLGFAIVNGRLPCPASSTSNGEESLVNGGACTHAYAGFLPAKAIGFQPTDPWGYAVDAWGNRLRYAVSANSTLTGDPDHHFTTAASLKTNGITVTPRDLIVCAAWAANMNLSTSTPSCGSARSVTNEGVVVAVIWSQGKNFKTARFEGVDGQSGKDEMLNNKKKNGIEPDEETNSNHGVFVEHAPAPPGASGGEFDDRLVWIPVGLLYGRMIAAGVLP